MAKGGELPGLDQPFEIPLRTVQDIIARRLRQQYRREGGRSGSRVASMVEQLIGIADKEIERIQRSKAKLDPKEFRELVRAVMDLRELQALTFRKEADGRAATTTPGQKEKPAERSALVQRGLSKMREREGAASSTAPSPASTSP